MKYTILLFIAVAIIAHGCSFLQVTVTLPEANSTSQESADNNSNKYRNCAAGQYVWLYKQ